MNETPRTLLEMAGVRAGPPPVDEAALILIDCQREYVDGALALPGVEAALEEAARTLEFARANALPVVHVQHRGRAGTLFDPAAPAFEIADAVAPAAGEARIEKALPNAFAGTGLDAALAASGRRQLIFGGFMTHMCVSSTVRAGVDLGYGCTVIADACATRDLPGGDGTVIDASTLHRAELAALSDRFATVLADAAALAR